ncbi:MAG: tetratricopeptide repeat protein, partial [Bryocella sp.]
MFATKSGLSVDEVEATLRAHLREKPDDAAAIHDLGAIAFRHGRPREAVHLLRQASRIEPSNAALFKSLGQVLRATGDVAGAAEAF